MNAFARIRAALEMSKHASSYCVLPGLERKTDDALPALAEIEQSIAARDSEIARLGADLELAELDSDRLTWLIKWLAAPENCRNIRFDRPMIDSARGGL